MDSPVGTIVSLDRDTAAIAVARQAACRRCRAGRGCGAGLLDSARPEVVLDVPLPPGSDHREGDTVRLSLEPAHLLEASLLAYGLPLAGLVTGPVLAWLVVGPPGDGLSVVAAMAGLGAGILLGRRRLARSNCLRTLVPTITGAAGD